MGKLNTASAEEFRISYNIELLGRERMHFNQPLSVSFEESVVIVLVFVDLRRIRVQSVVLIQLLVTSLLAQLISDSKGRLLSVVSLAWIDVVCTMETLLK